jgi:hypothetical protein
LHPLVVGAVSASEEKCYEEISGWLLCANLLDL